MPEIIQHGAVRNPRDRFPYTTALTCGNCGCVFKLLPGDQWVRKDDQREGVWIETHCPECRQSVYRDSPVAWSQMADPNWRPSTP